MGGIHPGQVSTVKIQPYPVFWFYPRIGNRRYIAIFMMPSGRHELLQIQPPYNLRASNAIPEAMAGQAIWVQSMIEFKLRDAG